MLLPITMFCADWNPKLLADGGIPVLGGGIRYDSTCSAISGFSWSHDLVSIKTTLKYPCL